MIGSGNKGVLWCSSFLNKFFKFSFLFSLYSSFKFSIFFFNNSLFISFKFEFPFTCLWIISSSIGLLNVVFCNFFIVCSRRLSFFLWYSLSFKCLFFCFISLILSVKSSVSYFLTIVFGISTFFSSFFASSILSIFPWHIS